MTPGQSKRRKLRSATIAVAMFASFSQLILVDAIARAASEQTA
jgi:hypothetical protein